MQLLQNVGEIALESGFDARANVDYLDKERMLKTLSDGYKVIQNYFSSTTALLHFKRKAMAEMNSQSTIDEDQEMETKPIYLSSDESEIASPCSSSIPQLPNNAPDTYSAITHLIAAQHEQMSSSNNLAPRYPPTTPTSFISDDNNEEASTPILGNSAQLGTCGVKYTFLKCVF